MAKNNDVSMKIGADSKGAQEGINKVSESLNKLAKSASVPEVDKLNKSVNNLTKSIKTAGWGAVISAEVKVLKDYLNTIKECTEAYNTQLKAERSLEVAAKNSPYLNDEGVEHLKAFASQLQSVSSYGDEELIPMMASLASVGRDEEEIMSIMSTAIDVAAGSGKSLDSVIKGLNSSFNGSLGELGQLDPSLKTLTTEELKSGKAVEVLSQKFKGQSEELTKATGSYQQMTMAAGDFKEAVGKLTKPASDAWNNFWLGFYNNGITVINKLTDLLDKPWKNRIGRSAAEQANMYNSATGQDYVKEYSNEQLQLGVEYLQNKKKLNSEQNQALILMQAEISYRKRVAKWDEYDAKVEAEKLKLTTSSATATAKTEKAEESLYDKYQKSVKATEDEIKAKEALNGEMDKAEKLQELLNTKVDAFTAYVVGGGNVASKEAQGIIADINSTKDELLSLQSAAEDTGAAFTGSFDNSEFDSNIHDWMNSLHDSLKTEVELMDEQLQELEENYKAVVQYAGLSAEEREQLEKDYTEKYKQLCKEREQAEKDANQAAKEAKYKSLQDILSTTNEFASTYSDIMSTLSDMVCTQAENEATVKEAELQTQLANGEISEEEYAEKVEDIEKESAEKQYKIQMWEWSAQLLQIGTNTAMACVKALAEGGPYAGPALSAMMATLGAVQLASAIANKPVPPSYATGGIVGGTSYTGDRVQANVNSGEMILNAQQQLALWKTANGQGNNGGTSVLVKNYMGGQAAVSTQITEDGLKLFIRKAVSADLEGGVYRKSLNAANFVSDGVKYYN